MRIYLFILLGIVVVSGCASTKGRVIDTEDKLIKCFTVASAGYSTKYTFMAGLDFDVKQAIKNGDIDADTEFSVEDWLKGYVIEQASESDVDEVYTKYIEFVKSCMADNWK